MSTRRSKREANIEAEEEIGRKSFSLSDNHCCVTCQKSLRARACRSSSSSGANFLIGRMLNGGGGNGGDGEQKQQHYHQLPNSDVQGGDSIEKYSA